MNIVTKPCIPVELRKFPYPFKACLSICNDIDGTDTNEKFKKIQTFMNETIGIRFTNTFFPFHDDNNFSLFSNSLNDKEAILKYIKEGVIDAMHSYGEKRDFTRADAIRTLEELKQNGCKLQIWIDHARSKSNLCKYRFFGKGDIPTAKEYHADLMRDYGIKFIWTERLTNITGQGVPLGFGSILLIFDKEHPFHSSLNIIKTAAKVALSICGYKKYDFFKYNALIKIAVLRDKQKIYEFVRFNNPCKSAKNIPSFIDLHYLISKKVLERLKRVGGYSIVYVHLGYNFDLDCYEGKKTVAALYSLKKEFEEKNIYVEPTSKVLNYFITWRYLTWSVETNKDEYCIYIKAVDDPIFGAYKPNLSQLEGITFYVPNEARIRVFNGNEELENLRRNPPDYTEKSSITIGSR